MDKVDAWINVSEINEKSNRIQHPDLIKEYSKVVILFFVFIHPKVQPSLWTMTSAPSS